MAEIQDFGQLIRYIEAHHSNPKALNIKTEHGWHHISSQEFIYDVKRLAYGLIALGLRRGDKVGILAKPSPYWTIADLAIILAGGISVPIFANISEENMVYQVAHANIRHIFISGLEHWEEYDKHRALYETAIGFDEMTEAMGATKYHDVLKKGEELWAKEPNLLNELYEQLHPDDPATIIYTCGRTGVPKGAVMSHRNLCHLISSKAFNVRSEDVYLSILPLAHVFGRQLNVIMVGMGISIYYLNELGALQKTCKQIKPTAMILVPRVLEKIYSGMVNRLKTAHPIARKLAEWAFAVANSPPNGFFKKYIKQPIAKALVFRSIYKAFGGRFRVIISGGAKLDVKLLNFFLSLGFPIYEGWGLTEGSTLCVNVPENYKAGSVGPILEGSEMKIGEQGEVLVKGPTVMLKYYRDPESSESKVDQDGWLHTGDKGVIDEEGRLTLIGLVKEQFKLSNGEYVAPEPIETALCQSPLIDYAVIVGEAEGFVSALLYPDFGTLATLKKKYQQEELSDEDFLCSSYIEKEMEELLEQVNSRVNDWSKVKHYRFIPQKPTIQGGELTPTLRVVRSVIKEKHQNLINMIYHKEAA